MLRLATLTSTRPLLWPAVARAALAAQAALEGARLVRLNGHLGVPQLAGVLPGWSLVPAGVLMLGTAVCLLVGLMVRPAALLMLAGSGLAGWASWGAVGGLGTPDALDSLARAVLAGGLAACLLPAGAGRWSFDSVL